VSDGGWSRANLEDRWDFRNVNCLDLFYCVKIDWVIKWA
jgi:hypothetical protein